MKQSSGIYVETVLLRKGINAAQCSEEVGANRICTVKNLQIFNFLVNFKINCVLEYLAELLAGREFEENTKKLIKSELNLVWMQRFNYQMETFES